MRRYLKTDSDGAELMSNGSHGYDSPYPDGVWKGGKDLSVKFSGVSGNQLVQ